MKKVFLTFLLIVSMLAGASCPAVAAGESNTPLIYLSQAPAYNRELPCVGAVRLPDGSIPTDIEAYSIAIYIRIGDEPYHEYYLKPDADTVSKLTDNGSFRACYFTDGVTGDLAAKYIHILLIPSDYSPAVNDYSAAKLAALDEVTIIRDEDGSVSFPSDRVLPEQPQEHSRKAALSVSARNLALNVGFYNTGAPNADVSLATMRTQLTALRPFTNTVRFYSASGTAYKAYALAHSLGFKVIGNAWISGNANADKAEMDALIEHANNGYLSLAVVGSETQYRRLHTSSGSSVSLDTLVADIEYVRERVPEALPVTTADTLGILLDELPKLRDACDLMFVNCYPLLEYNIRSLPIDRCVSYLANQVSTLKAVSGKQVILSETGWATSGTGTDATKAAEYFSLLRAWERSSGTVVCYFEAFDEPWKYNEGSGGYGAHWGLLDSKLKLKPAFSMLEPFLSAGLGQGFIRLPSDCTEIQTDAFADCPQLEMVYIPSSVTTIAETAFSNCKELTIVADSKTSFAYTWATEKSIPVLLRWW